MIVALINNKGGVAKTTSAVNLAAAWAHAGKKTLLIDLDPQASASLHLGFRVHEHATLWDSLRSGRLEPVASNLGLLDLVPGSMALSRFDLEFGQQARPYHRLQSLLNSLTSDYQHIVMDCPPALSLLTGNALVASDAYLVPVSPHYLAMEGLLQLFRSTRQIQEEQACSTRCLGILLTLVDRRNRLTGEVADLLRQQYPDLVLKTEIKSNIRLSEASSFGQSIFEYDRRCAGAKLYRELMLEVESRCLVPV
jgi:chromosome partitioning protein